MQSLPLPVTLSCHRSHRTHVLSVPPALNLLTFHDDNLNIYKIASALEGLFYLLPEVVSLLKLEQHGLRHKPTL